MTVRRSWLTSVVCASVLISFGLIFLEREKSNFENFEELEIGENGKIVAFSFLKQIEIESEEFRCEENISGGNQNRTNVKNRMWTKINGTNVFVYSAYHDRRLHPYDYLRIIAMVKGFWQKDLFCQISSRSGQRIVRANAMKIWTRTWNLNDSHVYYNPYLISCRLPLNETVSYFSITSTPCEKNAQLLKVAPPANFQKNAFTVCVKSLNFDYDISKKLLQWILINRILGASKFVFYVENAVSKTLKTLENIQKQYPQLLEVIKHKKLEYKFNIPEAVFIWQKRRYEIINYNDCLYRNLHTSQFVVPIDLDEIIVPRQVASWSQLFEEKTNFFASYSVRNAYYLRQFNSNRKKKVFFFDYDTRSEYSDERESGKSFVSTHNALTIFNHYALRSLRPGVGRIKFLKKEVVQMNHYKNNCDIVILPECAKYLSSPVRVKDDIIFKYKKHFLGEYKKWVQMFNFTL